MMTTNTTKRFLLLPALMIVAAMAFGIGHFSIINLAQAATAKAPVKAATKTNANSASLQPAGGQTQYRAIDGTAPAGTTPVSSGANGSAGAGEAASAGIVGMFGLNWKLFLAQLINFGIILFVLWKWVFGPVTTGLSKRTEKIENSLKDAEKIAADRNDFESWKQGQIGEVRTEAAAILTQAKRDAESLKADTLEQTKLDQVKLVTNAQVKLAQEKQAMLESVKGELASLVVSATESVLRQKLDAKKDSALIEQALQEAKIGGRR